MVSRAPPLCPGTGNRNAPGSRGGVPGTSGGMRLQTGTARLQTGLTSSMGRQAAVGIALQQGVHITDRPTTMQGMKGMKPTTAGPGRMVQDSTYFVGVLRGKVNAITEEIARLQKESEEHQREQGQAASMQRKAEDLDGEVRKLEGTLADYNIAMDKLRQGTDPEELQRCGARPLPLSAESVRRVCPPSLSDESFRRVFPTSLSADPPPPCSTCSQARKHTYMCPLHRRPTLGGAPHRRPLCGLAGTKEQGAPHWGGSGARRPLAAGALRPCARTQIPPPPPKMTAGPLHLAAAAANAAANAADAAARCVCVWGGGGGVVWFRRYIREYESRNKAFGHEIDRIFLGVKQEEQQLQQVEDRPAPGRALDP